MQGHSQLRAHESFPAAEGTRRPSLEKRGSESPRRKTEEWIRSSGSFMPLPEASNVVLVTPPSTPHPSKAGKRVRRVSPSSKGGPYLHPMPTIETIMTYPHMSRPVYNSLARGEPPAHTYKTVIHTPKPPNLRMLDQNLLRAAEMQAHRRRRRSLSGIVGRSRSNTASSSTSSEVSAYSAGCDSSVGEEEKYSSASDLSELESVASSCQATVASSPASSSRNSSCVSSTTSSPAGSPRYSLFHILSSEDQEALQPLLAPTEVSAPASPTPSAEFRMEGSNATSPALSFHTTHSNLADISPVPSLPSSAYPSPPTSPVDGSRRSSSSGEEYMAYPSPPPSPGYMILHSNPDQPRNRARRAFTFPLPPPASLVDLPSSSTTTTTTTIASASASARPSLRRANTSNLTPVTISSSSSTPRAGIRRATTFNIVQKHPRDRVLDLELDASDYDLGEQRLGGGGLDDDLDDLEVNGGMDWDWSMNGGEVVFGAAGVAVSPRQMKGQVYGAYSDCEGSGSVSGSGSEGGESAKGLGLYVIDERDEEL